MEYYTRKIIKTNIILSPPKASRPNQLDKSTQSVRQVDPVRVKVTFVKCINRDARRLIYSFTQHKQVRLLKEKFATPVRSSVFGGFLLERFSSLSLSHSCILFSKVLISIQRLLGFSRLGFSG